MKKFSITKAILFRSGIGWFVAESETDDNTLYFPIADGSDFDDFLKSSLITIKDNTATLTNTRFETKGTKYSLFNNSNALEGILSFLRGKDIKIEYNYEIGELTELKNLSGKIMGYQFIDKEIIVSILDDSGLITNLKANSIINMEPVDDKIKSELVEFMNTVASESEIRSQTMLRIQLAGEGKHRVNMHFLSEIHAWKISYRLIEFDSSFSLETYGIVDNTTLIDWEDAELTLSTRIPISYRYDLSTPHKITRPKIERRTSMDYQPASPPGSTMRSIAKMNVAEPMMLNMELQEQAYSEFDDDILGSAFEEQSDVEIGEAVEYTLKNPVSIRHNESSMVPLNRSEFKGGVKKHYFNRDKHRSHPFKIIELVNDLGYALDKGPLTVIDGSNNHFMGETMLPRIANSQEFLVPYALDQNLIVDLDSRTKIKRLKISVSGALRYDHYEKFRTNIITINNISNETTVVLVAFQKNEFVAIKKQTLDVRSVPEEYQVVCEIGPQLEKEFKFETVYKYETSAYLATVTIKDLEKLLKDKDLSEKEKNLILTVLTLAKEIQKLQSDRKIKQTKANNHKDRRKQIISTLEVLDKASGTEDEVRGKYIKEIQEIDESLRKLIAELEKIDEKINQLEDGQRQPEKYMKNKNFTKSKK